MIDKDSVGKVLPLSCVESYFIAWVRDSGVPDGLLYNKSFIPFSMLIKDFLYGNASYEHYEKIERVMTTAASYGFTSYAVGTEVQKDAVNEGLYLLEANKSFFENCALKPWREDHYVCIGKVDGLGNYHYINQFPLSEGVLNAGDIEKYFGRKTLLYKIVGNIDADKYREDEDMQFAEIIFQESEAASEIGEYNIKSFRDYVGIMRITRKRMQSWLRFIASERRFLYDEPIEVFFDDYFKYLDLLFVRLEAANLRGKAIQGNINEKISEMAAYEKILSRLIRLRRIADEHAKYY